MATIEFHANVKPQVGNIGVGNLIAHNAGSGLGFYGNGFNISVPVGGYQTQTYVTNSNGTAQGTRLNNTSVGGVPADNKVKINGGTAVSLSSMPNMSCPLNIRFTHADPVKVQNCKLYIFDRINKENAASGVTTYAYEARHPANEEGASLALTHRATDAHEWKKFDNANGGDYLDMTASPGVSGSNTDTTDSNSAAKGWLTTAGETHTSTTHDWFVALSSSPDSIGSKTQYGLFFQLEYLE